RLVWGWINLAGGLVALGPLNRARKRLGLPRVASFSTYLDQSGYSFLAVDERLAPAAAEWPSGFEYTRYPFLDQDLELPGDIRSFIDDGEHAPIYVGFGSMGNTNPEATTQMLLEALDASGSRAIISEGWAGLGGVSLPKSVLLVKEVSHAALFPRLSGVVHHGGAGTTHTAARAGVPQLLLPHITDQFFWARSVLLEGLGPQAIPASRVDAQSLAAKLGELDSAALREKARVFSSTMATRGAQTLVERLEKLASG
ncbi:MAG: glycosyltransferase, partial [Planctomycetota bacterium]|nr:glycosyltransferase [Planctomycetota bacterium]